MGRHKKFDPDAAVSAAMDLFWRNGYGATSPAELGDAIGIGKGSLYNAFDSKHALFEQALRRYGDSRVAALAEALDRPGSAIARIEAALARIILPENAALLQRGCMAVNTAGERGGDQAAIAIVRTVFERMERALATAVAEGQANGEIDAARDPKDIGALLLAASLGMTVMAKAEDNPERLGGIVTTIISMIQA
jgi:TetR/AcrR family transcriptional repressor of nem operon